MASRVPRLKHFSFMAILALAVCSSCSSEEEKPIDEHNQTVKVTGITVYPTSISLKEGEYYQLIATIIPENADNKNISWSSSSEAIATVDNNGKVTGVKAGSATITATAEDGGMKATCALSVEANLAPSVTVEANHISAISAVLAGKANLGSTVASDLKVGFQYSKSAGILPSNSTTVEATDADANYNYTTSITGLDPETTYYFRSFVRQNSQDTYGETKEFTTKDVASMLETRDASNIEATKATMNAKLDLTDVQYKSLDYGFLWGDSESELNTDFKCVEIRDNAISATLTELSHKTQYWYTSYVKLDDQSIYGEVKTFTTDVVPVESVSLDKTEYTFHTIGDTLTLKATVFPANATNKSMTWSSDKEDVTTVDANGKVTAKGNGTATIIVTTEDQSKTASCIITVAQWITSITLDRTSITLYYEGQEQMLIPTFNPVTAADKSLNWTSSNTSVATVDDKGIVTAVSNGTATIKAEAKDGSGNNANCYVTVNMMASSFVPIASVRAQAPTGDASVTIADGTMIKGTLLSNTTINNLSSKKILYVQDETGGVQIFLDSNSTFKRGDVIAINLSGASMKRYNGMIEIDGAKLANVANDSSTSILEAKAVSMEDFLANKYESQYVALGNVQVSDSYLNKSWVIDNKATSIQFEDAVGNTFVVRSSHYSTYKDETVPSGNGTIKGIATIYNGTLQLLFTDASDYAGLTGERQQPTETETTISAVLAGQVSGIAIVEGVVIGAGKTSFVLNDGGEKNLYAYKEGATSVPEVGSTVKVKGKVAKYGSTELIQLSDFEVSAATGTYTAAVQNSVVLDGAAVDAYNKNWAEYVTVTGKLKKSGNYFNIEISGATRVGSVVATALTDKLEDGAMYDFTGYFRGISGTNTQYFNILPSNATYFEVPNLDVVVGSDKTSTTINVVSNVDWTAVSDNDAFTLDPASGNGSGVITVTFEANTDTENAKVAHVTVSTTAEVAKKEFVVTITQSRASAAGEQTYTLDGDAIKAAHSADWSYTSGTKSVTATDGSVWTLVNTYANKNQVTVQMNKGKSAYVLTPSIPEGNQVTRIAVELNTKNDGTGEIGTRPIDISNAAGTTVLLDNVSGNYLKNGLYIPAGYNQVRVACDEGSDGGAVYIASITITYAPIK